MKKYSLLADIIMWSSIITMISTYYVFFSSDIFTTTSGITKDVAFIGTIVLGIALYFSSELLRAYGEPQSPVRSIEVQRQSKIRFGWYGIFICIPCIILLFAAMILK